MSQLKRPELLLNRLDWTVLRRLEGLYPGEYSTLFRGGGLDLADLREYQPADDVRHIDWNVTARLQHPYIRIFHEDRELTAWFLVDLSGSLDAGWTETRKRDVALQFTALLARVLSRHGNRVGAILFGYGSTEVISPAGGRLQVLRIVRRLMSRTQEDQTEGTDLNAALMTAGRTIRRRSLLFLISDFVSSTVWSSSLARLYMRHETIACRVVDPMERSLPDMGIMVVQDAETGEQVFVDSTQARVREAYDAAAIAEDEAIEAGLANSGVDCIEISTQDDPVDVLLRFSLIRKTKAQTAPQEV